MDQDLCCHCYHCPIHTGALTVSIPFQTRSTSTPCLRQRASTSPVPAAGRAYEGEAYAATAMHSQARAHLPPSPSAHSHGPLQILQLAQCEGAACVVLHEAASQRGHYARPAGKQDGRGCAQKGGD